MIQNVNMDFLFWSYRGEQKPDGQFSSVQAPLHLHPFEAPLPHPCMQENSKNGLKTQEELTNTYLLLWPPHNPNHYRQVLG
jgi:hypothetical protein